MTNIELAELYKRDLQKLVEEINLFEDEDKLWKTFGTIKNSAGNLALHIAGGLNHHIGTNILHTGFVRNRDAEFSEKNISRAEVIQQLNEVIQLTQQALNALTPEQMNAPFPKFFDKDGATNSYVLTQLLLHLNYHLGQVNYLRRALE